MYIVEQKFVVLFGQQTYTAKLAEPGLSTAPPMKTSIPSKITRHPSVNGYVWLNEYTSDNENNNECTVGHDWSGIVISRMPVGCHRFQHIPSQQDEMNHLVLEEGNRATVKSLGMICDTTCRNCVTRSDTVPYKSCIETWGGSIALYSSEKAYCTGGGYVEIAEGAISIFRYTSNHCNLETDASASLYIRNYPSPTNGNTCSRDGTTGKYYQLMRYTKGSIVFFEGMLDCVDAECSYGCSEIKGWQEGACNLDTKGDAIQIWESSKVLGCNIS